MRISLRTFVPVFAACLFTLAASRPASADTVTFSTAGAFTNIPVGSGCTGEGTNVLNCPGGRQLVYVATTFSQDVTTPFTYYSPGYNNPLGTFQFVNLNPSTAVGPLLPGGVTFTLTITQLAPTPGVATFVGTITVEPMVALPYSQNVMTFSQNTLSIGIVDYQVHSFFLLYTPFGPAVSLQTPEPMSVLLLGTGLAGLAGAARRRRARR